MKINAIKLFFTVSVAILSLCLSTAIRAETVLQPTITFVIFTNDVVLSPIILRDLHNTELSVVSENLLAPLISNCENTKYQAALQNVDSDYLITGTTDISDSKVIVTYKVINIKSLQIIKDEQHLILDNDSNSLRYGAHAIADKLYEIVTEDQENQQK